MEKAEVGERAVARKVEKRAEEKLRWVWRWAQRRRREAEGGWVPSAVRRARTVGSGKSDDGGR